MCTKVILPALRHYILLLQDTFHTFCDKMLSRRFVVNFLLAASLFGILIYTIVGVFQLVRYRSTAWSCESSDMWLYCVFSIILQYFPAKAALEARSSPTVLDNNSLLLTILYAYIISVAMMCWGALELFRNPCDELLHSEVWIFAFISWIKQIVETVLLIVVPIGLVLATEWQRREEHKYFMSIKKYIDDLTIMDESDSKSDEMKSSTSSQETVMSIV